MTETELLDEGVQDRWVYLLYDDQGRPILLARDEWEALHRSSPDDQG
jgi:hypothetical protein